MIRHKGVLHEGGHEAIVKQRTFENLQLRLDAAASRHKDRNSLVARARLTGKLFNAAGEPMSPTFSHGRKGKVYRYYVSTSLQKGGVRSIDDQLIQRVPASAVEGQVREAAIRLLATQDADPLAHVGRVEIHRGSAHLLLPCSRCGSITERLGEVNKFCSRRAARTARKLRKWCASSFRFASATSVGARSSRAPRFRPPRSDATLIGALRKAHSMITLDTRHMPVCDTSPDTMYERRLIRLAFLAPDLQAAILDGPQPAHINLAHLIDNPVPLSWTEQRTMFAR